MTQPKTADVYVPEAIWEKFEQKLNDHDIPFYLLRARRDWTYIIHLDGRNTEILALLQEMQRKGIINKYYTN